MTSRSRTRLLVLQVLVLSLLAALVGRLWYMQVVAGEEYRAGHIAGAVSIPVGELRARLKELPKDREIVAYCRGPYCVMAVEAVTLLRKRGFSAQRMEQGIVEWRARGWRIETAAVESRKGSRSRPRP